ALLIKASNTARRRSRASSACTTATSSARSSSPYSTGCQPSGIRSGATTSTRSSAEVGARSLGSSVSSASGSSTASSSCWCTQTWADPGPNGPSTIVVYGTTSKPPAADIRYAATSRPARLPDGKSHSSRSPRIGLYTSCTSPSGVVQEATKEALEAVSSRPVTARSPASWCNRVAGWDATPSSEQWASVAIGAWTDVALGLQRLQAERARRPPGCHQRLGAGDEVTGIIGADAHDAHLGGPGTRAGPSRVIAIVVGVVVLTGQPDEFGLVITGLGSGEQLDHHAVPVRLPGQGHVTDAELLGDRR